MLALWAHVGGVPFGGLSSDEALGARVARADAGWQRAELVCWETQCPLLADRVKIVHHVAYLKWTYTNWSARPRAPLRRRLPRAPLSACALWHPRPCRAQAGATGDVELFSRRAGARRAERHLPRAGRHQPKTHAGVRRLGHALHAAASARGARAPAPRRVFFALLPTQRRHAALLCHAALPTSAGRCNPPVRTR